MAQSNNDGMLWYKVKLVGTFICTTEVYILATGISDAEQQAKENIFTDEVESYDWEVSFDAEDFEPEDVSISRTIVADELNNYAYEVDSKPAITTPPPRRTGLSMGGSAEKYLQGISEINEQNSRKSRKRRR